MALRLLRRHLRNKAMDKINRVLKYLKKAQIQIGWFNDFSEDVKPEANQAIEPQKTYGLRITLPWWGEE